MPHDNIKKAIQRGTGEIPGVNYEEVRYEGDGRAARPFSWIFLPITRTAPVPKSAKFSLNSGGNIAEVNAVGWMFAPGDILLLPKDIGEEELLSTALDSGADDVKSDDEEVYEILTAPADLEKVKAALKGRNITPLSAEATLHSSTVIPLTGANAENVIALVQELDEHDDVKAVYSNFDVPKEVLEKASK